MKKKWIVTLLCLFMSFLLFLPVSAQPQLNHVTDAAGILDEQQSRQLEEKAKEISEKLNFGFYIVTVDDFTNYVDTHSVGVAAESIYLGNELGMGEDQSGLMLMLSMSGRDYAIYAFGYGNTAFTDYGKDYLAEAFLPDFANDDWYNGFDAFLDEAQEMVGLARSGNPVDVDNAPLPLPGRLLGIGVCVLLGMLAAFFVTSSLKNQMKSVAQGIYAEAFVNKKGLQLSDRYDRYTRTTRSRVYDPPQQSKSSSGSSGGTTTTSSGGSVSSGKF